MRQIIYITGISIIVAVLFLFRFFLLKREIKRACNQLVELNNRKTEKKLDLVFFDKDFEHLAIEINAQIDLTKQADAEKKRKEIELKQAIANISHDIRTPLTSILGYIQFLELEELSNEEKKKYTAIVKSGALRLKVLLEDFFELSIIESSDYQLKNEKIKMNNLVLETLVGFYEQFKQENIEPAIHIPEEKISLITDPSAVKRVIENLVLNAIKHSNGNVVIRLKKSLNSIQIIISNKANQINEHDLKFLFDRFYKSEKTRTGKGAGLGLTIAKSLMVKMGGDLHAELLQDNTLIMICEWKSTI